MIGDDVRGALPEMRAHAESLMTLTLEAQQPGQVTDDAGRLVPGYVPVGAPVIGKIQGSSAAARDTYTRTVKIGGVDRPVLQAGLHIPIGEFITDGVLQIVASDNQAVAWRFKVTAGSCADDASMVGRIYQVVSVPAKSYATARRLDVVEV